MSRCHECDDFVGEWGKPICRGCYCSALAHGERMEVSAERLRICLESLIPYLPEAELPRVAKALEEQKRSKRK